MAPKVGPQPKEIRADDRLQRLQVWFLGIIAFAVVLFILVQAKFLLISLAIAIMLFSLTAEAIGYFQNLRIGGTKISISHNRPDTGEHRCTDDHAVCSPGTDSCFRAVWLDGRRC